MGKVDPFANPFGGGPHEVDQDLDSAELAAKKAAELPTKENKKPKIHDVKTKADDATSDIEAHWRAMRAKQPKPRFKKAKSGDDDAAEAPPLQPAHEHELKEKKKHGHKQDGAAAGHKAHDKKLGKPK